jgi:predicted DsbA family dithiol-disulfide isomerase
MGNNQLTIDYFSDILCVWAWISQRRIDELNENFAGQINIRFQFIDIFGDTRTRIETQWADKGSYKEFGKHVVKSASPYKAAIVNNEVWNKTRPATSANAHMMIKAIELTHSHEVAAKFATTLRSAFFIDTQDIGDLEEIYSIASKQHLNLQKIKHAISCGEAIASLMRDYQNAKDYGIKGSPCFVMNEGRQILFGNVGYRVLHTNIEELLSRPNNEASWC